MSLVNISDFKIVYVRVCCSRQRDMVLHLPVQDAKWSTHFRRPFFALFPSGCVC